jgi:preprotein translocase subunit SecE
MAQESKDKTREVDEEDEGSEAEGRTASSETMRAGDDEALTRTDDAEGSDGEAGDGEAGEGDGEGEEHAAAQLGTDRYVLAGFFAAGMMAAYILGLSIQSLWAFAANKTWFARKLPLLASVPPDDMGTYGFLIGGIAALVGVYRTYKRSDVRAWSDEVAAELAKVVWPSRKEVTNSTFIVIVASTVATLYLFLLDRLWSFVTNIVYGDGT